MSRLRDRIRPNCLSHRERRLPVRFGPSERSIRKYHPIRAARAARAKARADAALEAQVVKSMAAFEQRSPDTLPELPSGMIA